MSHVKFSCRLPIVLSTQGGDYAMFQGGFITFPQATFKADPAGVIHSEYLQRDFVTDATPVLHGAPESTPFYDLAMKRWVPASPPQTSPDGAFYAYSTTGATSSEPTNVRVVDVAHATERAFSVPTPAPGAAVGVRVAEFDGAGVYLVSDQFESFPIGVWRLDVASGLVHAPLQVRGVMTVHNGSAWVGRVDPRDPAPPRPRRSGQYFDSIVQVDIATGSETLWYYAPGSAVLVRGFDRNDHPVLEAAPAPDFDFNQGAIRLVQTPGDKGIEIWRGGLWLSDPQRDVGRLWFGSNRGIYMFTAATGLQKVYGYNGDPTVAGAVFPVGFCV